MFKVLRLKGCLNPGLIVKNSSVMTTFHNLSKANKDGQNNNKMGCEQFHVDFKTVDLNLFDWKALHSDTIFKDNISQDIFNISAVIVTKLLVFKLFLLTQTGSIYILN